MKLIFGSDHAGFELRRAVADWARSEGHEVVEVGAQSTAAYDYPLAADAVACELKKAGFDFGVLVCGTGIGVCIRANRYPHIRAAECTSEEMARLARQHNYANVLCIGGRILSKEQSIAILSAFLETGPDDAERHARRVQLLDAERSC
ncbi:MAG TPA: RpiB/LacA/LacB family sugar-phosphate isomerase [Fimbriimonadaceae bacterium]|nr:RpiB/LacA/LacB family sugar-phosphate isomerase [Fimbriimonadaceae bacterium]